MKNRITAEESNEIFLVKRSKPDLVRYLADKLMKVYEETPNMDIVAVALCLNVLAQDLEEEAKSHKGVLDGF